MTELVAAVGTDQSTVSKHLTGLKDAGHIGLRKKGSMNYYRVTTRAALEHFFGGLDAVEPSNLRSSEAAV